MMPWFLAVGGALLVLFIWAWVTRSSRNRRRARTKPFPVEWLEIIRSNLPYFEQLSHGERIELADHIKVFLEEKRFEGAGGLTLTDEMRVTIAAQACVLLLGWGRKARYYPLLHSIIVYPSTYLARVERSGAGGERIVSFEPRAGESWTRGTVVLAWDEVVHGAADMRDGHNVVLHEFAHQLDSESGETTGSPLLPERTMYTPWARVLGVEYQRLLRSLERHQSTLIRSYGATHPAEFFAVVTELFFEKPHQLKKRHRELYDLLAHFYSQDPLKRMSGATGKQKR